MGKDKVSNEKVTNVKTKGAEAPEAGKKVVNHLTEDLKPFSEGTVAFMDIPVRTKNEAEYNLWKCGAAYANIIISRLKFADDGLMLVRLEMRRIVREDND